MIPPKTTAERMKAMRDRRKSIGLVQVQNIYAPLAMHAAIRKSANALILALSDPDVRKAAAVLAMQAEDQLTD